MVSGSETNVCMFVCLSDIQTTCLSCCHGFYYSAIENNYMPFKFCIWIKFLDFTEPWKYSTQWKLSSHQCAQPTEQTLLDLCQYFLYWLYIEDIIHKYIPNSLFFNPKVARLVGNETALIISILDPESCLLSDINYI